MQVTADTLISDVLASHSGAAAVFERHGLPCASCLAASLETVSAVALSHDVRVEDLLEDIRRDLSYSAQSIEGDE